MSERGRYGEATYFGSSGRGQYRSAALVGQSSLFGHTPTEVDDELEQLNGEILQFGQEVIERADKSIAEQISADPEVQRLRADEKAAFDRSETLPQGSFDRIEAVKQARVIQETRAAAERRLLAKPPLLAWKRMAWDPFVHAWNAWYSEKKDIPMQTWPLSGTWDHIQDQRKKLIDIRNAAPFKSAGPAPLEPRKDPTFTGIIGDVGKFAKWGLIGILGITGVVLLSSVAMNLRKGRDPIEHYAGLYRGRT